MLNYGSSILDYKNRDFPDDTPVSIFRGKTLSLVDYETATEEIEEFFWTSQVKNHTSAILFFDDCPLAIAVYLGCIRYGIVPLLISRLTLPDLLDKAIETAGASYIITDGVKDLEAFRERVTIIRAEGNPGEEAIRMEIENPDFRNDPTFVDSDEIAYFLMTSGSSGIPKIVMHSHPAFLDTTENYAVKTLHMNASDVVYSISKMTFGFGLANSFFFPLLTGAAAYLMEGEFTPQRMFEQLDEIHPTVFFAVPSAYRMLLDYMQDHPDALQKLDSVRLFVSSGEMLKADLAKSWKEKTGRFLTNNMGSSEASAILYDPGRTDKYGSAGLPVPGTEIRLLDESGRESDTGVLYFTSKGNSIGYHNNEDENRAKFVDGWFRTGDVFRRDEDGYYWGLGREDNLLKYHGMWIAPDEIEKTLLRADGVEKAVILKLEKDGQDQLVAVLVTNGAFQGTETLPDTVLSGLEPYKWPQSYRILDALPLNQNGKTDLRKLKALFE